jgi:PAS domain S-box-containing protein
MIVRKKISLMSSDKSIQTHRQKADAISMELEKTLRKCEKLEHINKMLSQVIQVSSIPTFVIDSSHTVILWNKALEKLTGKTQEEMLGTQKQWMAFYRNDRPVMADLIVDAAVEQEIEKNYQGKYRKALIEGGYEAEDFFPDFGESGKWLFFTAAPLFDETGSRFGAIETLQDITTRKISEQQLTESEEQYRVLTENVADGVVLVQNGRLVFSNRAFKIILGYDESDDLVGADVIDFISESFQPEFSSYLSRLEYTRSKQHLFQVACTTRKGHEIWAEMHVHLIQWQGRPAVLSTLADITESRQRQLAIKEEAENLRKEVDFLKVNAKDRYRFGEIIGKSKAMQQVYELIQQASATDASVIIQGESGTGKEMVSKEIHRLCDRRDKPFVPVNCGAIPEHLVESEFFGFKKGAFTGAYQDKKGFLDQADGGVLFLDEVGEIGLNMQVKLLRAIDEGGFTPIGGSGVRKPDIRLIAATNRSLPDMVKNGAMRKDFYYRINIIPIYLPPLRERKEDLTLLIDYFIEKFAGDEPVAPFTGKIIDAFFNYDWPGNIRELQNIITRYVSLKTIDFVHELPTQGSYVERSLSDVSRNGCQIDLPAAIETLEKRLIRDALVRSRWHRGKAAEVLKIDRKTLYVKLKKYNIFPA